MVLEMKLAEDISIIEQQNEFISRYKERKEGGKHPGLLLSFTILKERWAMFELSIWFQT